ncbi:MAG: aminoacyl-tRNA hydrolase [Anaerovoracaceae bacterium]|nr:aminoacyl-tRNA hydrolase [Bacillota bacterium]MDY3954523.1 aminoacyl-tRNA hydrolase [Anaerovoracaceae bacterium]
MYIIAGLGNPGKQYENTKHNVGFQAVDLLAEKHNIKVNKIKFKALVGEGIISGQKVLLVKPQTFMNLSGNSIREVMAFYKLNPENLIVIYDDIDVEMGRIRIRRGGSAGTHNGMRSILYDLQEDQFPRIRIGIAGQRKGDLADYVLGGFAGEAKELAEQGIRTAVSAAERILADGIDRAMNEYNVRPKKEKKEKADEE